MAAKTLFLLLAATLIQAALCRKLRESDPSQPDLRNDWPCPEEDDIKPCVCTRVVNDLNLDCSAVKDDVELENVFKAHFPFENMTLLTIIAKPEDPRIPINFLQEDVFQNVTFSEVRISHTDLSFIYPTVFDKSVSRLETLIVTDSFLTLFPFDLVDSATSLTDLRVFRNEIQHLPELTSDTLTFLEIAYNPGIQFGDHAFEFLPNLEYLVANDIDLSHVGGNAFYQNKKLKYLDLSHNLLETLYIDSLNFDSPIEEIKLNSNIIHTVEAGAISGLGNGPKTFLWMHNNNVVSLDQQVWEPVFNEVRGDVRSFTFDGNPLECSCNVLWLVREPEHMDTISRGAYCVDTETDIHDVDLDFLLANCP